LIVVKTKLLRYNPLLKLAQNQIPSLRNASPTFLPTAMSHEGEFSSHLIRTTELLTKSFRADLSSNGTLFPDGVIAPNRTAEFRTNLKDALICTSLAGVSKILLTTDNCTCILGMSADEFAKSNASWEGS
jgi:hypothetical protein